MIVNQKISQQGIVLVMLSLMTACGNQVEIEAFVDSVDLNASTLTLLNIVIQVDNLTVFNDDVEEKRLFGLADLKPCDVEKPCDYVEMQGFEDPPGSLQIRAARIERKAPKDEVQLEGTTESADKDSLILVILGVTIQATVDTSYLDADHNEISADEFFSQAEGTRVDSFGSWDGATITATRLELN